ncbi:hypothetical protein XELAEV_18013255mg [Xenopus laevis]|uniref:Uncharacterized protein n=1 Tax=Xenopus laevis TaxID=8355 RepID=A0A974HZ65_XENLA|nr:hypothetical protein XELAEV_18013255mg [Xenopus laevis]
MLHFCFKAPSLQQTKWTLSSMSKEVMWIYGHLKGITHRIWILLHVISMSSGYLCSTPSTLPLMWKG